MINDNCHAIGASIKNNQGYAVKYADLVTHSYHPVKNITTGEGGAITTNNKELYENLLTLRTHGMTKDTDLLEENHGGWYYEMHELGYNYRITDMQCALGISQLKKLNNFVLKRRKIAQRYNNAFENDSTYTNFPFLVKIL